MTHPRLLFLNPVSRISGAERSLLDLVRHLDRDRFELFAALPPGGELPELMAAAGVACLPVPMRRIRRPGNPFRVAADLAHLARVHGHLVRLIRRERIDLVHANSSTAQLYGGLAAQWTGVPCLWHVRDLTDPGVVGGWLDWTSTCAIAISRCVGEQIRRRVSGAGRLKILHNGIDVVAFAPAGRRAAFRSGLGIPAAAPVFGMVAQLVPWKRHEVFIQAAAQLAARLPAAQFVAAGEDLFRDHAGRRAALEAQAASAGLSGKLHFLGYRQDVRPLLEGIDVLLHPAEREPLGRALLEAMAMGRPVVAVRACGPAEIVRDGVTGRLVASGSADELADAALGLIRDPALAARLGAAGRQAVERDFNIRHTAVAMEAVYHELLPGARRGSCA